MTGTLGAGGMGEVYRAHDARPACDVALKVLPDVFAADPERLASVRIQPGPAWVAGAPMKLVEGQYFYNNAPGAVGEGRT